MASATNTAMRWSANWRRFWIVLLLAGLAACARTPKPAALSRNGQLALAQISTYLNNLQKFRADFTQAGPRGPQRGVVWIDRPGRLRVEYAYPGRETILANRGELLILNPATGATTTMPVAKTPLDILLRGTIPLTGPVTVTALRRQPGMVSLTLVKTNAPGQGTLTLTFSADPLKLRGLTIEDRTGRITSLALERIERNPHFVPGQFTLRPASAGGRS